jgi:tRNA (pseudouridine54-N1)-methyltransferase
MPREFVVYSRTGHTGPGFNSLREAGRLDLVYQSILMAIFKSHGLRKDVVFRAFLGGPPNPPRELVVDGSLLHDVRTDERTWEIILRNVLDGKPHPGISVRKNSFQNFIKERQNIYVLEESGESIRTVELGENPCFVLGDQVGLPIKEEKFVLRTGTKISLGGTRYMTAQCVGIINYVLDLREVPVDSLASAESHDNQ